MKKLFVLIFAVALLILGGCAENTDKHNDSTAKAADENNQTEKEEVVIGYFPNLNHAPAIVAKEKGLFEKHLADDNVDIKYMTFSGGSDFMTALATGEVQAGLVGPGPAMNSYISGVDAQLIAAASTGGTVIVSREGSGIETAEDIDDQTFISPHVGCTHDVQFETYMKETLDVTSNRTGGTMNHVTGKPAQYPTMFENGDVDIATAPEPWASVLEAEQNAHVVIDTPDISFGETLPAGVFVSSGEFIDASPEIVQHLIDAHEEAIDFINENEDEAIEITQAGIADITGQELDLDILKNAWTRTYFQADFDGDTIQAFGDASFDLKFLKEKPDFKDFINKQFLN